MFSRTIARRGIKLIQIMVSCMIPNYYAGPFKLDVLDTSPQYSKPPMIPATNMNSIYLIDPFFDKSRGAVPPRLGVLETGRTEPSPRQAERSPL